MTHTDVSSESATLNPTTPPVSAVARGPRSGRWALVLALALGCTLGFVSGASAQAANPARIDPFHFELRLIPSNDNSRPKGDTGTVVPSVAFNLLGDYHKKKDFIEVTFKSPGTKGRELLKIETTAANTHSRRLSGWTLAKGEPVPASTICGFDRLKVEIKLIDAATDKETFLYAAERALQPYTEWIRNDEHTQLCQIAFDDNQFPVLAFREMGQHSSSAGTLRNFDPAHNELSVWVGYTRGTGAEYPTGKPEARCRNGEGPWYLVRATRDLSNDTDIKIRNRVNRGGDVADEQIGWHYDRFLLLGLDVVHPDELPQMVSGTVTPFTGIVKCEIRKGRATLVEFSFEVEHQRNVQVENASAPMNLNVLKRSAADAALRSWLPARSSVARSFHVASPAHGPRIVPAAIRQGFRGFEWPDPAAMAKVIEPLPAKASDVKLTGAPRGKKGKPGRRR